MRTPLRIKQLVVLFILIVTIKFLYAYLLAFNLGCANPETQLTKWCFSSGDTFSYTGAMENYVKTGSYFFFNGRENVYAGRLPHYSIPYFLFRQILTEQDSYNALVLLQLMVESVAILVAFLLCLSITNSFFASYSLLGLLLLAANWTLFSIHASPESFSCSFCILFSYTYYRFSLNSNKTNLLLSGLFLGGLVVLKPYFALVYLVIGVQWLFRNGITRAGLLRTSFHSLIVSLPLLILLCPWIVRNYSSQNRIFLFQQDIYAGYNYTKSELAFRKYVSAWGENFIFWERSSAGCYFMPSGAIPCDYQLPAFSHSSTEDSLAIEQARKGFIELQRNHTDSLDLVISNMFVALHEKFKKQKPFHYYIAAPVKLFVTFILHSGSYYLPFHKANPCFANWQYGLKGSQSLIYWLSLLVGVPGLFILSTKQKDYTLLFLGCFILVLFPIGLKAIEWRYLRTIEPLLCIGTMVAVDRIFTILKRRMSV